MLGVAAALLFLVGLLTAFAAFSALANGRVVRFVFRCVAALALLAVGGVLGVLLLGLQGMEALTREETAARIKVVPTGPQRYEATVTLADGRSDTYELAGDDIAVDAHIVKWTPLANQLGLHTSYRLGRIAGRYQSAEQENTATRTIYPLGRRNPVDLVLLGQRFPLASLLYDAEYGSATFVPVLRPAEFELKVSTSGLLMRPVAEAGEPR